MNVSKSKYGWSLIICLLRICAQAQPSWKILMDAESNYVGQYAIRTRFVELFTNLRTTFTKI